MSDVTPIQIEQQEQIVAATDACLYQAGRLLEYSFDPVPVLFDLKGRAAGMYKVNKNRRIIRYNPYIFARYFDENLTLTVPHEVAHYVVDVLYGMRNILPHGQQWRNVMHLLNAEPSVTCRFDLEGMPTRHYKKFIYRCSCRVHELTRIRHNRVLKGMHYSCRSCKQMLVNADG